MEVVNYDSINYEYSQIKGLKASVGGYFNGVKVVEINFNSKDLTWSHIGSGDNKFYEKKIKQSDIEKLIEELKAIKLLNWKSKYIEPEVWDRTQWSIEIIKDGRNIKKYASNKFPYEWESFCKIIRGISKKSFGDM